MPLRARPACVLALGVVCLACAARRPGGEQELLVFAAASLSDIGPELGAAFERETGARVSFNFAASNALAQQILAAPAADVFISADRDWVTAVTRAGKATGLPTDLFGNELVVVARHDSPWTASTPEDLAPLALGGLAIGDPDAVPAGRYARRALQAIAVDGVSLWQRLESVVVPTLDVRAALALVASDSRIAGVVYRTDAESSRAVRVLCGLPLPPGEAKIAYRAVAVAGGEEGLARRFLDFARGPQGRAIGAAHGFSVAP